MTNKKTLSVLLILTLNIILLANGNPDKFELGCAIYRSISLGWGMGDHWHAGNFMYFEYKSNGYGCLYVAEQGGASSSGSSGSKLRVKYKNLYIGKNLNRIINLKNEFIIKFRTSLSYHGAYGRATTPSTLSSITSTARNIAQSSIGYTSVDMIDSKNIHGFLGLQEDWKGTIADIDEIRCDGVVEYSYEKNGVMVSKAYLGCNHLSFADNIATPGNGSLAIHNSLHDGTYDCNQPFGELCPRIQAGEDHRGSGGDRSYLEPLIAADPVITDFTKTQQVDQIQLHFKAGDNASVKAYVLIQVKKSNESTWRVLKDENGKTWKFRAVDLTDWNGTIQSDNFYVPWNGKYEGGSYGSGSSNFNIKITVIDQGASHKTYYNSFTGNIVAFNASISGPGSLESKQQGTYTAHVVAGSGSYTYKWYKSYDNNNWGSVMSTASSITTTMLFQDFYLKCVVKDNQTNLEKSATYVVYYSDGGGVDPRPKLLSEAQNIEKVPETYALKANYPNPFNPTTTIKYQLSKPGFVSLKVYDMLGREVANLVEEQKEVGFYQTKFNASKLTSGIYFYTIKVNNFIKSHKMILTK